MYDETEERPSTEPSILHAFSKSSKLWQSKDLSGSRGISNFSENNASTILKVYTKAVGRTGNNIFQYLATLSIAHRNNRSAVFNSKMSSRLKGIFPKIEVNIYEHGKEWNKIVEISPYKFEHKFFNLPQENIMIAKFFQSFKYFQGMFGDMYNKTLSYFDQHLQFIAREFIRLAKYNYRQRRSIKETKITSVCIHVRRGDFLLGKYILPSSLDIQNAMNYLQNKFKHLVFIVASDGLKWCKVNLNRSNVYFSPRFSVESDFVLMCSCDHMIMTAGTFGWWGAWFTSWRGGIAMYHEHLFPKFSPHYKFMSRHDQFPPHWLAYTNRTIIESKYLGEK